MMWSWKSACRLTTHSLPASELNETGFRSAFFICLFYYKIPHIMHTFLKHRESYKCLFLIRSVSNLSLYEQTCADLFLCSKFFQPKISFEMSPHIYFCLLNAVSCLFGSRLWALGFEFRTWVLGSKILCYCKLLFLYFWSRRMISTTCNVSMFPAGCQFLGSDRIKILGTVLDAEENRL